MFFWGVPLLLSTQGAYCQSEGLTERINEPPWGRCLQGAVDVRWVVVVVVSSSPRTASSRALGITVTLLRSNGDVSMGLDDGAAKVTKISPNNSQNL